MRANQELLFLLLQRPATSRLAHKGAEPEKEKGKVCKALVGGSIPSCMIEHPLAKSMQSSMRQTLTCGSLGGPRKS
jgi:hypothetical protein